VYSSRLLLASSMAYSARGRPVKAATESVKALSRRKQGFESPRERQWFQ
jgi:hypothetical protein